MTDRLAAMFAAQAELNARVGVDVTEVTRQDWLLQFVRCAQQELAELTDCVAWKHWAEYQKPDWQNARVEVIDLLHFVLSLALTVGMSADDLYDAYCEKMAVNHTRQDAGYTEKRDDCRHIGYRVVTVDLSTTGGSDFLFHLISPDGETVYTVLLTDVADWYGERFEEVSLRVFAGWTPPVADIYRMYELEVCHD